MPLGLFPNKMFMNSNSDACYRIVISPLLKAIELQWQDVSWIHLQLALVIFFVRSVHYKHQTLRLAGHSTKLKHAVFLVRF
jgi:hypothetical protein